ncbi:hypothetical protein [Streptomyces bikiniensis]|uniref:hypothetical protein n=1 Tax=Streptomyces bikiniensis TaxID=1896 RepID=UPI0004C226A2|nr:hypothetical protein [Streptomyces bikiniensis]
MTTNQFDGHRFSTLDVVEQNGPDSTDLELVAYTASCSCGWKGSSVSPGMEGKGGYNGPVAHGITLGEEEEAELAAEKEWLEEHIDGISHTLLPPALADQIRSLGEQIDALIEADKPMNALSAIRLSGGYFSRQARDAALRASYLDHSWAQIGEALGISKQAAWERYGKPRPERNPE